MLYNALTSVSTVQSVAEESSEEPAGEQRQRGGGGKVVDVEFDAGDTDHCA